MEGRRGWMGGFVGNLATEMVEEGTGMALTSCCTPKLTKTPARQHRASEVGAIRDVDGVEVEEFEAFCREDEVDDPTVCARDPAARQQIRNR